jgi:RimJ/RimL family protein N-acetyltransferase
MQHLVDMDFESNVGLLVCTEDQGREAIVAMARYDVDPATRLADIAFVVRDEWQCRGIGTLLMRRLIEIGRNRGLVGFTADVLTTNKPMLAVFERSGLRLRLRLDDGVYHILGHFDEAPTSPAPSGDRPLQRTGDSTANRPR